MKLFSRSLNVQFLVNKHRPLLIKFTQSCFLAFKHKIFPFFNFSVIFQISFQRVGHYVFPKSSNTLFIVCLARY